MSLGIDIDFNCVQLVNAPSPIVLTVCGIIMGSRLSQYAKASSPIDVTLFGISILCKLPQP